MPHPLTGLEGEDLAIDVAVFGPDDADVSLFIVSGTHGVEGYCGSALQSHLLEGRLAGGGVAGCRIVMLHALNPFGFSWVRRVNEDNVDLNRNFIDWSGPTPVNTGYDELAELILPAEWTEAEQQRTTELLLERVAATGFEQLQADVSGGQYRHATGVFYGGAGPTWSNRQLQNILGRHLSTSRRVHVVDLHTGLGPWGHGELITSYQPTDPGYRRGTEIWGGVTSMYDGTSTSAPLVGDWLDTLDRQLPESEVTAIALEYGTVDPVTVLQALRADAWLHANTTVLDDPELGTETRATVRAAFIDDDPAWLEAVTGRFDEVIDASLAALV